MSITFTHYLRNLGPSLKNIQTGFDFLYLICRKHFGRLITFINNRACKRMCLCIYLCVMHTCLTFSGRAHIYCLASNLRCGFASPLYILRLFQTRKTDHNEIPVSPGWEWNKIKNRKTDKATNEEQVLWENLIPHWKVILVY